MKNIALLKHGSFFEISFLFSFLCHLFFFSSFIVVLPLRTEKTRPDIIFLGAILREYDVEWLDAAGEEFRPLQLSSQWQKGKGKERILLPHAEAEKPLVDLVKNVQAKTTIKRSFLNETDEHLPKTNVDPDSTFPSYRPLRYHND